MADAGQQGFDFNVHEQQAVTAYLQKHAFYDDLATVVRRIVEESLKRRRINVHSVQARAKDPASFGRKAAQPSDGDPTKPKYAKPLDEITDLAGVRVIAYFPSALDEIDSLMAEEFRVVERSDKGAELVEEERFGYKSIHYLVKLVTHRAALAEYAPYAESVIEVQVRTIMQHAWAEIEHDIQYKSAEVIPVEIRRRFMALAGLLEIADREFQAIQDADRQLTQEARSRVAGGQLDTVEITPDALKAFLDKRIGSDGRISEVSYNWTARLLRRLGFRTLEQVERCIRPYDDDRVSRAASGSRQGQTSRFEDMLLAGMGERFITEHLWAPEVWWGPSCQARLKRLKVAGIPIGDYDPQQEADSTPTGAEPVTQEASARDGGVS
jgi:ppGpp synthetase/RelA/SpoT-type nucleotidyltranferase